MVDNLISAWEQGADTVVMTATMGPCRLGEYGELLKTVLDRQGCIFRWILLDSVSAIGRKEFMKRLSSVGQDSKLSTARKILALKRIYQLIKSFERLEQRARITSGYERKKGASFEIVKSCRSELEKAPDVRSAQAAIRCSKQALKKVALNKSKDPVKLLVTGEIFTSIDPFGNQQLEERLMQMGVTFERRISLGWWIDRTILNPFGGLMAEKRNNPYMPHCIGGYAKETVKEAERLKKKRWDGIIQLFPVGCMPEIVAKSVFDGLGRREGLSVLSIVHDEMRGEAGYITRIEAFVDMLQRKKEREEPHVLSRNRRGVSQHGSRHHG